MVSGELVFVVPGELETTSGGYAYDRKLIEQFRKKGISVRVINLPGEYPYPTPDQLREATELLSGLGDSPVIIDGLALGVLETEAVSNLRAPLLALVHHPLAFETGLDESASKDLLASELRNLQYASRVVVPSSNTAALLEQKYSINQSLITVANPGLDLSLVDSDPATPPLILSVGIHTFRKGHDVLIRALSLMQHLSWQAVIVGAEQDGQYSKMLHELVSEMGLESRLTLLGRSSDEQLQELYSHASIFALATRHEGYGMVFQEALANGLPVVSCDAGATKDTVGEAALLVAPDSPEEFAKSLSRLLDDSSLRQKMAEAARKRAKDFSSWEDTAEKFLSVLASL